MDELAKLFDDNNVEELEKRLKEKEGGVVADKTRRTGAKEFSPDPRIMEIAP